MNVLFIAVGESEDSSGEGVSSTDSLLSVSLSVTKRPAGDPSDEPLDLSMPKRHKQE